MNPAKLEQVTQVAENIITQMGADFPDLIVIAGDLFDEADGRIALDSPCARAAMSFVTRLGAFAPVFILRGTPSHDRATPMMMRYLGTVYPVEVCDTIGTFFLNRGVGEEYSFSTSPTSPVCVINAFPTPGKEWLVAHYGGQSIQKLNAEARQLFHDVLTGFGQARTAAPFIPSILVGHGMLTGAPTDTGYATTGEDFEYSIHDLSMAKADYVALGHVHKRQVFGNIAYAGSPARLNFGETGPKGYLVAEINDGTTVITERDTPAWEFAFIDDTWGGVSATLGVPVGHVASKHVRYRITVAENEAPLVDKAGIEKAIMDAGAASVKIEVIVTPSEKCRAAGISQIDTMSGKLGRWCEINAIDPARAARLDTFLQIIQTKDPEEAASLLLEL